MDSPANPCRVQRCRSRRPKRCRLIRGMNLAPIRRSRAVADPWRLLHVVGADEHGDASGRGTAAVARVPQLVTRHRVEPQLGSSQDQQPRSPSSAARRSRGVADSVPLCSSTRIRCSPTGQPYPSISVDPVGGRRNPPPTKGEKKPWGSPVLLAADATSSTRPGTTPSVTGRRFSGIGVVTSHSNPRLPTAARADHSVGGSEASSFLLAPFGPRRARTPRLRVTVTSPPREGHDFRPV